MPTAFPNRARTLRVTLGRSVSSFQGFQDVLSVLASIDRETGSFLAEMERFERAADSPQELLAYDPLLAGLHAPRHRRRHYKSDIKEFRTASPPTFTGDFDVAWISILITFLRDYGDGKKSIKELSGDLAKIPARIERIAQDELAYIDMTARLYLETLMRDGEALSERMRNRFRRARQRLVGSGELEIEFLGDDRPQTSL